MKRFGFLLAAAVCAAAVAEEVDGVLATVGEDVVLRSEVVAEMNRLGVGADRMADVRDRLVDRRLVLKAAGDAKLTLQDWVVDNRVREIIDDVFGGDRNRLVATLANERMSYADWRSRIKEDMVAAAMRWNRVERYVTASPAEMKAEYESHPDRYRRGVRVSVSVLLLRPADAERRAEIDAALATQPFAELAKRYSADPRAAEGGRWTDVDPSEVFRPEIVAELEKLPVGALSKWIDLDGWSFLLKKESVSEARRRSFAEAYDDVEKAVKARKAEKLHAEWMARLREEAYIKIY